MEQKVNFRVDTIAETAILISLSFILRTFLILFKMPNGGSVNLGLTPLIILSFRRNFLIGCLSGFIVSIIHILSSAHVPPASNTMKILICMLFDYLVPYSCVGVCSILKKLKLNNKVKILLGVFLVFIINITSFCVSGLTIWSGALPDEINVFKYVIIYNIIFAIPNFLINLIACILLSKFCNIKELDKNSQLI